MLNIKLHNEKKISVSDFFKYAGDKNNINFLVGLNLVTSLASAFETKGYDTLISLESLVISGKNVYNDDYGIYKVYNAIVDICNGDNATDYSYVINMLKIQTDDYSCGEPTCGKTSMVTNVVTEKPINPNMEIRNVLLTLLFTLGIESFLVLIKILIPYDVKDLAMDRSILSKISSNDTK